MARRGVTGRIVAWRGEEERGIVRHRRKYVGEGREVALCEDTDTGEGEDRKGEK